MKTDAASMKRMPCLMKLLSAFSGSHSNSTIVASWQSYTVRRIDSHIHRAHVVITAAGSETLGRHLLDAREVALGELHLRRADVLLEIGAALGAWNRRHVVALRQHPCERELTRRDVFFLCDRGDAIDHLQIRRHIVGRKTRRNRATRIVVRQLAQIAAQKTPSQRAERNESDAELAQRRDD